MAPSTLIDRFLARRLPERGIDVLGTLRSLLKRLHITYELSSTFARFRLRDDREEAVTIADDKGATMVFKSSKPSRSAVLEELAQAFQALAGSFAEDDIRVMLCEREIEAKQCLVTYKEALRIPEHEHKDTLVQLTEERRRRDNLRKQLA